MLDGAVGGGQCHSIKEFQNIYVRAQKFSIICLHYDSILIEVLSAEWEMPNKYQMDIEEQD